MNAVCTLESEKSTRHQEDIVRNIVRKKQKWENVVITAKKQRRMAISWDWTTAGKWNEWMAWMKEIRSKYAAAASACWERKKSDRLRFRASTCWQTQKQYHSLIGCESINYNKFFWKHGTQTTRVCRIVLSMRVHVLCTDGDGVVSHVFSPVFFDCSVIKIMCFPHSEHDDRCAFNSIQWTLAQETRKSSSFCWLCSMIEDILRRALKITNYSHFEAVFFAFINFVLNAASLFLWKTK